MATKAQIDAVVNRPYTVDFEYGDSVDEGLLALLVEWPDCFAAGRNREEAIVALERTMRDLAAFRLDQRLEIPEPAATYSGKLQLRLSKQLHRDVARRATKDGVSLNSWLSNVIAREIGPSEWRMASEGKAAHGGAARPPKAARTGR